MLADISPFNAGKKKEEALEFLKKWFPQMENFSGQLKKYKVTIEELVAENSRLEERAKAGENGKMKDRLEKAELQSELLNAKRMLSRIPPELLAQLKPDEKHQTRDR